jgi:Nucleotidyl transferase AbiEii toxin, Type IV TA system
LTIDESDLARHTLLFQYPSSAPDVEHTYIRGMVKIELGWRSVTLPSEVKSIISYIADSIPMVMKSPEVICTTLASQRTFWEKVTALHAESFREGLPPRFYSRHYSDVAEMLRTKLRSSASDDLSMLDEVRKYKELYYYSAWARYDLAVPGTLVVVPSDNKVRELAADYRDMRMMFFRDPPTFGEVIAQLRRLQEQINNS